MSITQENHINGVDTATLFATIGAVRDQPELAKFQFRTVHDWVSGTHSEGRFPGFYGAGQEHTHVHPTWSRRTTPPCSSATTTGPTPAELLLNALGACLMAGTRATSPRPAASSCTASAAGSRATSTCAASSASTTPCATASSPSAWCSRSTATRTPRASRRWSSSRASRSAVFDVLTHGTAVTVEVAKH